MLRLFKRIKAKLGRHYKLVIPFLKVIFSRTLEGKDPNLVIIEAKKEPKKFYKATIYTLPKFVDRIINSTDEDIKKDYLRELLETFPLLLQNIIMTKEPWYIAKIDNHPFDVWMAPEKLVEKKGENINIYRGLHIQTKRVYVHPVRRMTLKEWVTFIENFYVDKIVNIDFGFNGHIHLYNCIPLNENVDIKTLNKVFKNLYIPYNKYVDSISISIELKNKNGDSTIATWLIYPRVFESIGIFDVDYEKVRQFYSDSAFPKIIMSSLKEKIILGNVELRNAK